jgi:hypothetical protein
MPGRRYTETHENLLIARRSSVDYMSCEADAFLLLFFNIVYATAIVLQSLYTHARADFFFVSVYTCLWIFLSSPLTNKKTTLNRWPSKCTVQ